MVFGMKRSPEDTEKIFSPREAGGFALLQNTVSGSSKGAKSRPRGTRSRVVTNDESVYPEQRPGGHMDDLFLPNWEAWSSDVDRAQGD